MNTTHTANATIQIRNKRGSAFAHDATVGTKIQTTNGAVRDGKIHAIRMIDGDLMAQCVMDDGGSDWFVGSDLCVR